MKFGRAILENVSAYVPGEQPASAGVIKLNTNENPYPPSPRVLEALVRFGPDALRRYPDPLSVRLRETCARVYGYESAEWVIAGNGMDELLALALRTFVNPGEAVMSVNPTYTLYETLCALHGARYQTVGLSGDFQLPDEFFSVQARLCFLPRPNAPTGVAAAREEVARFCESFNGIVVIDEAYVDFGDDDCMDMPKSFENVIVMRTFSKAFSLAGMRLGTAVARPEIIREFLKTKDSYNLNAVTQAAGGAALEDYAHMEANAAKIRKTRDELTRSLRELGFNVPDSQANFVYAEWHGSPSAKELFQRLREQNIFVRHFSGPRVENALRITVGTGDECAALVSALRQILGTS